MSVFRPEDIDNAIEAVHTDFKVKYYKCEKAIFKTIHINFNFPLFHEDIVWRIVTPQEPVNYKLLEETNIRDFFHYHLHHSMQHLQQEANKLNQVITKTKEKIETLFVQGKQQISSTLKAFYEKCVHKWKYYQMLNTAMKQMIASINDHIKREIVYFKKYREKQRKKIKYHYKNHQIYFRSVHHEIHCFFKVYKPTPPPMASNQWRLKDVFIN